MTQLTSELKLTEKKRTFVRKGVLKKLLQLCKVNVILIDSKSRYLSVFLIGFESTVFNILG